MAAVWAVVAAVVVAVVLGLSLCINAAELEMTEQDRYFLQIINIQLTYFII